MGDEYTIILSTTDENGSIFNIDGNENCCLKVSFDFLLEFNCDTLLSCASNGDSCDVLSILTGINLTSVIEATGPIPVGPIDIDPIGVDAITLKTMRANRWVELAPNDFYTTTNDFGLFLDGNENTGLLFSGENCDGVIDCIMTNLDDNCTVISADTFNSDWVHVEYTICDSDSIAAMTNEEIKLGIKINGCSCDFSLLLDNIRLDKVCTQTRIDNKLVNSCPSFQLKREIDNKKSWVNLNGADSRNYNLIQRDTNYLTNHERLVINTKEVDLNLDGASAIECGVFDYVGDNDCVLNVAIDNAQTGTTAQTRQTINDLLSTNISEITDIQTFIEVMVSELVDVKDRKVLQSYPTIRWLYEAYLGLVTDCELGNNQYTYCDLNEFIGLVNTYWYELFEQVIPSTTIWGATTVYRNSILDQQKFQYKRYSLFGCGKYGPCDMITSASTNVDLIIIETPVLVIDPIDVTPVNPIDVQPIDISGDELMATIDTKRDATIVKETPVRLTNPCSPITPEVVNCDGLYAYNMDDGSSFVGKVTIIKSGGDSDDTGADVISIAESLDSLDLKK